MAAQRLRGAVDWAGVVDPTLRVLPDDAVTDDVVRLPGEAALATWTAHRCHLSLAPLFAELCDLTAGALSTAAMWRMVGTCVVVTATGIPLRTGAGELICMRRGQAVLDALTTFGLPVRALPAPAGNRIPGPRRRAEGCSDSRVPSEDGPASRTRVRPCRHRCVQPEQSLTDKIAFDAPFDNQIGLVFTELTPDGATAYLEVQPKLLQPMGIVHGACTARSSSRWPARRPTSGSRPTAAATWSASTTTPTSCAPSAPGRCSPSPSPSTAAADSSWLVTIRDEQDRVVARGQVRLQNLEADPPQ